jgi:hypothetical protein
LDDHQFGYQPKLFIKENPLVGRLIQSQPLGKLHPENPFFCWLYIYIEPENYIKKLKVLRKASAFLKFPIVKIRPKFKKCSQISLNSSKYDVAQK